MQPVPIAIVLLVDPRGWLLLQERDSGAPIHPDQWGMPGGHVDPGEEVETAAYRELEEETGLALPSGSLRRWREFDLLYPPTGGRAAVTVYTGTTTATDADIVVGEGRQIVFVDPDRVADLDLAGSAEVVLPAFLASDEYSALTAP